MAGEHEREDERSGELQAASTPHRGEADRLHAARERQEARVPVTGEAEEELVQGGAFLGSSGAKISSSSRLTSLRKLAS